MTDISEVLLEQMVALCPPATRDHNDSLYPQVVAGNQEARTAMIQGNMSLVITKVDHHISEYPQLEYLRGDMVSEGFVGLTDAVNKMVGEAVESPNPTGYISFAITRSIGEVVDREIANGLSTRHLRRMKKKGILIPQQVDSESPAARVERVVDPTKMTDLRDLLLSCCESDEDRIIVDLREKGYSDREIAKVIETPVTTTYVMRRELYGRFLAKAELKGEV